MVTPLGAWCPVTYIYALADPETGQVRYVGKADKPASRLRNHLTPRHLAHRTKKNSWLKGLLAKGLRPELVIVDCVEADHWEEVERGWIAYYLADGCDLTNGTEGGDGLYNPTPDVRAKMATMAGKTPWNKGRKLTPAQCANNARAMLGKPGYWTGKRLPPHVVAQMSERRRGATSWNKGVPLSEDRRNKLSLDWLVTDPAGTVYQVRNLATFCRDHGLTTPLMNKVAKGLRKHHRGWTCCHAP